MCDLQKELEKEIRQLKLQKAEHFEELNLQINQFGKKALADYFKHYGEICYDIKIKERELLSFSKNILEN